MTRPTRSVNRAALAVATLGLLSPPLAGQELRAVAHRAPSPPVIDGVLDEPFWSTIEPITGFRQRDPVDGAPASERTEVRVAFDENALYFGMTMFDSEPHLILRNILQRGGWIDKDDHVVIALDTYRDRRNAYIFEIGALGTQDDALVSDESRVDWNWDGVYETEARVTDEGWVLEVAIPFTTIRFGDAAAPEMGLAIRRAIRRKNEDVFWPHIGQEFLGGIAQASRFATLTGLENLRRGRHIEVKPFAIAGAQDVGRPGGAELERAMGLDVKAALSSNVTLDVTWNTDFAQVEADNVQINLTRFDLFFPEKREFFLERSGLFQFGAERESEVFFSRRVGLDQDISGGSRLTGQAGPLSFGAMTIRTAGPSADTLDLPATYSSVARIRGDLRPRTTVGGIFTSRETDLGYNRVAGADLNARFWSSSSLFVWAANVWDSEYVPGSGDRWAGQAELILRNDLYFLEITRTRIGQHFDPALGFVRRPDQKRWGGQFSFMPRFETSTWARQLTLNAGANHITGIDGDKQSHLRILNNTLSFQSGDRLSLGWTERFERLTAPDRILGRELPDGDYRWRSLSAGFVPDRARTLGPSLSASHGDFWSGTRTQLGGGFVWKTSRYLTVDAGVSWNDVSLPVADGDFSTTLLSVRLEGALNRRLFANALVQWDDVSETLQSNIRIDWIHTPGSDLFVVIDTGYLTGDLLDPTADRWQRRTGVVKLTYLKAF